MRVVRYLTWGIRILIFLFLFAFAFMNTSVVTLNFFLGQSWQVPLILLVFGFFAGGVLLGILTMVGMLFRERRTVALLRRDLENLSRNAQIPVIPASES
jgi:uncharacterized integral membrane protein